MNLSSQGQKNATVGELAGSGGSDLTGVSVMQRIIPENINLFTSPEGIYIAPLVGGLVQNSFLVPWGDVEEVVERMKSLKRLKSEVDNGEFPF